MSTCFNEVLDRRIGQEAFDFDLNVATDYSFQWAGPVAGNYLCLQDADHCSGHSLVHKRHCNLSLHRLPLPDFPPLVLDSHRLASFLDSAWYPYKTSIYHSDTSVGWLHFLYPVYHITEDLDNDVGALPGTKKFL